MAETRAHVIVHGLVQGVCFRAYTQERAHELGVRGWVRNRYDGTVEAVFEGERKAVEAMVQWCHKGPPWARVTQVDVEWEEPQGEPEGFSIRASA